MMLFFEVKIPWIEGVRMILQHLDQGGTSGRGRARQLWERGWNNSRSTSKPRDRSDPTFLEIWEHPLGSGLGFL